MRTVGRECYGWVVRRRIAAVVAAAALAGGCSGGGHGTATRATLPTVPGSATPAVSPLTGLPGAAGRLLAVKIDNIRYARPQTGVNYADVVYAIEVEGGLSRFLTVYDSGHLPPGGVIGPVRSARESDLPILAQYGKVDFVYSGALSKFLPLLARADIVNASPDQDDGAFFRSGDRQAPYNEFVRPRSVLATFPSSPVAHDVGFRFGPAPGGGTPTASLTARMPSASFAFTWDAAHQKYLVSMDGSPAETTDGGRMGAPTIVIQKVAETTSPHGFMDTPGELSPYAPTIGSGQDVVLRDGRAYNGTWSRPTEAGGTAFTFEGRPMPFHAGQVWVVLEPG
jgi:hypothetical protein